MYKVSTSLADSISIHDNIIHMVSVVLTFNSLLHINKKEVINKYISYFKTALEKFDPQIRRSKW